MVNSKVHLRTAAQYLLTVIVSEHQTLSILSTGIMLSSSQISPTLAACSTCCSEQLCHTSIVASCCGTVPLDSYTRVLQMCSRSLRRARGVRSFQLVSARQPQQTSRGISGLLPRPRSHKQYGRSSKSYRSLSHDAEAYP